MKVRDSPSREYNRIKTAKLHSRRERDDSRVDGAADPVCSCGWITGLDECPNCGGQPTGVSAC